MDVDEVYREYSTMVFKFLISLTGDPVLSEELTQETFYQAVKSVERFDGTCKVSTWFCQIAKNLWLQWLEKDKLWGTPVDCSGC